jgi:glutamate synthase domain-containing protein 1
MIMVKDNDDQGLNGDLYNPHGDDKVCAACGLFGIMDLSGRCFGSSDIVRAITNMHERGNGLGGGFAAYGLYPELSHQYAFHIMYLDWNVRRDVEEYLGHHFKIALAEPIPTRPTTGISDPPILWRYFVTVGDRNDPNVSEEDYVVNHVMRLNSSFRGVCVFSSGQDTGVFKGVGYPEQVAEFFRLEEYKAYTWVAHSRFPTNTSGWWGGAHPFAILDWTVVHNGEISSYGINRRYLEMWGYLCTMQTDTEVMAYAVDLLIRRHNLPVEAAAKVLAPPLWAEIDRMPFEESRLCRTLRQIYPSLLMNGPFTVIISNRQEMIGLTDRIRLRPLIGGAHGDTIYLSSEEAAIHLIDPAVEKTWIPMGGEPIIGRLHSGSANGKVQVTQGAEEVA